MEKPEQPILFDTGPVISLAMNNLLWILESLRKQYKGRFYITPAVRKELIDTPIQSKKFKFEALQILYYINKNVIDIIDIIGEASTKNNARNNVLELLELANHCFRVKENWLQIVHYAEVEAVAAALQLDAAAVVIDERTMRLLIENPQRLVRVLEKKLHTRVYTDKKNLQKFLAITKNIRLLRSAELAIVAYKMGLLDKYVLNIPKPRKQLLQSILWAIKLNGCAISREEIDAFIGKELGKKA